MTPEFTRSEMYELVWTEPRTTLAKHFGVSDVAVAKHCRAANIPMPPPGYWARKLAGKAAIRPVLPLRVPGQRDIVFPGEDRYGYGRRKLEIDHIPIPPSFAEPVELLVSAAAARMGRVHACRDLSKPHPGMNRLVGSERRRRENWEAQRFHDHYKPYFDEPVFQRQLRLINSLLWGFERIGCRGEVFASDEWIQGIGQLRSLQARICIGTTSVALEFLEPSTPKVAKRSPRTGATTLRVVFHSGGYFHWHDQDGCKLEKQLTDISVALLELAKTWLRRRAMHVFEQRMDERRKMIEAMAARKAEDEKKRLEAIDKHHRDNRARLRVLAAEHDSACAIRRFVQAVREHPKCVGATLGPFADWETNVLEFADSIDPIAQPILRVFSDFAELPDALK